MKKNNWCTHAPDWLLSAGAIGRDCCQAHDKLYETGGDVCDRLWADVRLLFCIINCANRKQGGKRFGWIMIAIAHITGIIYFLAVRIFGTTHFNWQNAKGGTK